MTIHIDQPELEAIIEQLLESGRFETPAEVVAEALRLSESELTNGHEPAKNLKEVWARAKELGVDLDITRHAAEDQARWEKNPCNSDHLPANELDAMFAKVRGIADDLDFSRIPSTDRPVDL